MSLYGLKRKLERERKRVTNVVSLVEHETILEGAFVRDGMSVVGRRVKRAFDFLFACILIMLLSPLYLVIFIAIKLDDGASAIYTQERIGRYGHVFKIYKFRSMRVDAEVDGPQLSVPMNSDKADERMTRVGSFLRQHHLDELPQLWNIVKGEMSFVGYRPERKFFIDKIMKHDKRYVCLYQSRPGLTSYATLYNGYTDTMEKMLKRLEYDLYYLQHRSWLYDMKIILKTFWSALSGKDLVKFQ